MLPFIQICSGSARGFTKLVLEPVFHLEWKRLKRPQDEEEESPDHPPPPPGAQHLQYVHKTKLVNFPDQSQKFS